MMLVVPLAGSVRSVTTEGALSRRAVLVRTWTSSSVSGFRSVKVQPVTGVWNPKLHSVWPFSRMCRT